MSNARRSIAQLRAEKETRYQDGLEGIRLRNAVGRTDAEYNSVGGYHPSTHNMFLTALLEDANRACVLLEHFPGPLERALAHECKALLQRDLGQIGDAMTSFHAHAAAVRARCRWAGRRFRVPRSPKNLN